MVILRKSWFLSDSTSSVKASRIKDSKPAVIFLHFSEWV
jgi:hypothetical protein